MSDASLAGIPLKYLSLVTLTLQNSLLTVLCEFYLFLGSDPPTSWSSLLLTSFSLLPSGYPVHYVCLLSP